MKRRSKEMVLVAYFLARSGVSDVAANYPKPPPALKTTSWRRAYAMFYEELGAGRTLSEFSNSLKNMRDQFDSHLQTGRVGWRQANSGVSSRPPLPLTGEAAAILSEWAGQPEQQLWTAVATLVDSNVANVPQNVLDDAFAERVPTGKSRTEGGTKVYVSARRERNPFLRAEALRIHGALCAACSIDLGAIYGSWASGFAEVHHAIPLAGAVTQVTTDPEKDLVVLCPNCHRIVHRKHGVTLSLEELKAKINISALKQWADSLA